MVLRSLIIGFFAAVIVAVPRWLWSHSPGFLWTSVYSLLGILAVAITIQRMIFDAEPSDEGDRREKGYRGLADFLLHIHTPPSSDADERWSWRGFLSFLLCLLGWPVGEEGAAAEIVHGAAIQTRSHSSHWFETQRRTDVAASVAAATAAAFASPFAAVILTMELGMGGRVISAVSSALAAFVCMSVAEDLLFIPSISDLFGFPTPLAPASFWPGPLGWVTVFCISAATALVGVLLSALAKYSRESLQDLFKSFTWMRILLGGIFIFLVAFAHPQGQGPSFATFFRVVDSQLSREALTLLFVSKAIVLSLILATFGSAGILWPLLSLGGIFGAMVSGYIPFFQTLAPELIVWTGAAVLWGSVLGSPLSAAVLCFELTGSFQALVVTLCAGYLADTLRKIAGFPTLLDQDLGARGVALQDGRSTAILESVTVREAVVTDHVSVTEHDNIGQLYEKLMTSQYPFLPVVSSRGKYIGLLTADLIEDAWRKHQSSQPDPSNQTLGRAPIVAALLEAKDLLYRAGIQVPTVNAEDRLSVTSGVFEQTPVVPVIGSEEQVVGLLFFYNVRIIYDREMARQSFLFRRVEL